MKVVSLKQSPTLITKGDRQSMEMMGAWRSREGTLILCIDKSKNLEPLDCITLFFLFMYWSNNQSLNPLLNFPSRIMYCISCHDKNESGLFAV